MIAMIAAVMLGQLKVGDHVYARPGVELYRTSEAASARFGGFERPYDHGEIIAIKVVDGEKIVRFKSAEYEIPPWAIMEYLRKWDDAALRDSQAYEIAKREERAAAIKAKQASNAKMKADLEKMEKASEKSEKQYAQERAVNERLLSLDYDSQKIVRDRLKAFENPNVGDVDKIIAGLRSEYQAAAKSEAIRSAVAPFIQSKSDLEAVQAALAKGLNPLNMSAEEAKSLKASQRKALSEIRRRYQRGGAEK